MQRNISSFFSGSLKRKKQNVESCDAGQTANKKKFVVKYDRHRAIKSECIFHWLIHAKDENMLM